MKRQQQRFDRFLTKFNFENLNWNKKILRGKPHQEILRAIHDTKPDLLLMGSMGKTGLTRIIMGSTTEKVVREMPCSVITVKQEHVIRLPLEKEVAEIETHFRRGKELLKKEMTSADGPGKRSQEMRTNGRLYSQPSMGKSNFRFRITWERSILSNANDHI